MIEGHSERICTTLALDYEPQIGFATKLSDAADAVQTKLAAPHWAFGTGAYLLRDPINRLLLGLDYRRMFSQTLGLNLWQKRHGEYGSLFNNALEKMNIKTLKRVGFKLSAYLVLGMSHPEMVDLFFGSFLLPAKDLDNVCGKAEDAFVQLHGTHKNMKLQMTVAPMTEDQAVQQFLATPNLDQFAEPKLIDLGIKNFRDRLSAPCLFVDVDLFRTECAVADLRLFLTDSLAGAQLICEQTVLRLKSLKPKRG